MFGGLCCEAGDGWVEGKAVDGLGLGRWQFGIWRGDVVMVRHQRWMSSAHGTEKGYQFDRLLNKSICSGSLQSQLRCDNDIGTGR